MSIPRITEILESKALATSIVGVAGIDQATAHANEVVTKAGSVVKEVFARPVSWLGVTAVDNSADSITVSGADITFVCVSGNIWINPAATAVANTTAIKLVAGQSIDINVATTLSIISDASGATYQYIIW